MPDPCVIPRPFYPQERRGNYIITKFPTYVKTEYAPLGEYKHVDFKEGPRLAADWLPFSGSAPELPAPADLDPPQDDMRPQTAAVDEALGCK